MPLPSALATTSIDALRAHCAAGTTVRAFQRIDEQPLRRWSLMLHASTAPHVYRPPPLSTQTNAAPMLPWSAHWAFFQGFDGGEFPLARASSDGLLPVLDARRRWAGGSFAFAVSKDCYERNINSMCMSDLVERRTRIASVQEKRGRSGRFAVVGIRDNYHVRARVSSDSAHSMRQLDTSFHDPARSTLNKVLSEVFHELSEMGDGFAGNSDPAMTEIREIVYPLQPFAAAVAAQPLPQPSTVHAPALGADTVVAESTPGGLFAKCNVVHMVRPSTDLLFRFSSLTGNTHRIHYDADYARREEGLSGCAPAKHCILVVIFAQYTILAHVTSLHASLLFHASGSWFTGRFP